MKILMVCLGNICRSPLAEGILQAKANDQDLEWQVASAGTGAYHVGEAPDIRSQKVALAHGLDISAQRAQQFKRKDFESYDLVFAMDQSNYQNILALARNEQDRQKVHLILELSKGKKEDVPDPYWNDNGFEHVYQLLDKASDSIIQRFS